MARYTQEDKDRALGALMASAVLTDGEWVPNFLAVERQQDMPTQATLHRWWKTRDRADDTDLRRSVTSTREENRAAGVRSHDERRAKILELLDAFVLAEHVHGQQLTEQGRPYGPTVDQSARALTMAAGLVDTLETREQGVDDGRSPGQRLRRLREHAMRAGLIKKKDLPKKQT